MGKYYSIKKVDSGSIYSCNNCPYETDNRGAITNHVKHEDCGKEDVSVALSERRFRSPGIAITRLYSGVAARLKAVIYKIIDTGPTGGTLNVAPEFNTVLWANAVDIISGAHVTTIWAEGSESIAVGAASSSGNQVRVLVLGW